MRYYSIFTEKGLLDLFNSNVIVDLPPQFVPPLEHEDILAMLRQLRSDIAKDNICGLITRPTQLKLPDYLSISVSAQNKINIYPTNAFYLAHIVVIFIFQTNHCAGSFRISFSHCQEVLWYIQRRTV